MRNKVEGEFFCDKRYMIQNFHRAFFLNLKKRLSLKDMRGVSKERFFLKNKYQKWWGGKMKLKMLHNKLPGSTFAVE